MPRMRASATSDDRFYWEGFEGNPVLQAYFDNVVDNWIPSRLSESGISSADDTAELSYLVEEILEATFYELYEKVVPRVKQNAPHLIYEIPVSLIARTQEENSETVHDAFWFLITRFLKVQLMSYLEGMLD